LITVTGWTLPSPLNSCVIPTFLPMIPVTIRIVPCQLEAGSWPLAAESAAG
jgi:hypothetical protein